LRGAVFVQPELFPADTHTDTGVPQNHRARNPATAWRAVEYVPILIDDGYVSGVLYRAVHYLRDVHRLGGRDFAGEGCGSVFPLFDFGIEWQRIPGLERSRRPFEIDQLGPLLCVSLGKQSLGGRRYKRRIAIVRIAIRIGQL